jgi:hypothetical protein
LIRSRGSLTIVTSAAQRTHDIVVLGVGKKGKSMILIGLLLVRQRRVCS